DAPRYDRARQQVEFDYHRDTAKARELLERSLEDLMRDGEVSQETYALWDALESADAPAKVSEAA
ncbi:hypothetical protein ACMWP8_28960, partial [Escherichia coli]|uniref:hypothetical protein n=1 Tax=Escherichia coli TaxID=562 RepID=UPI0039DFDFBC